MHGHRQQKGQEALTAGPAAATSKAPMGVEDPAHQRPPPQHEQGDAAHLHAKAQRHQRMAEFVQHHREGQQQRREEAVGRIAIKLLAKQHRGQHQNKSQLGWMSGIPARLITFQPWPCGALLTCLPPHLNHHPRNGPWLHS